jgi:hypothetical protein
MKRERTSQVVLVLVGLFYSFWGYLLFDALWHSRWLNGHNDVLPMFLSLNTVLGVFLLLAVKQPVKHRSLIAYGAWSSLAHGFTMTIQSAEAAARGMHRRDSPQDIVIFGIIGIALLALLPGKQSASASAGDLRTIERANSSGGIAMQRPGGVTLIVVLDFVSAAICLLVALAGFVGGSFLAGVLSQATPGLSDSVAAGGGIILGIAFLIGALIFGLMGFGLIKLQNWARILTIVLTIFGSVGNLVRFGVHGVVFVQAIFLVYYIWVVWYLFQPHVKAVFGQQPPAQAQA